MYDVIVVGARCAGSPLAMQLARKGHRVALVDRAAFPSDTLSTHFIQLPGVVRLREWGLLDRLLGTGCPPMTSGKLDIAGQALEAEFPAPEGVPGNVAPRRTILDKLLVDAAVEAGAELHDKTYVDSLIFEEGRVTGIKGRSETDEIELKARFVVGADGRNSLVAREVESESIEYTPALGNGYYSYWSDVDVTGAEISLYEDFTTVAFPTHDGLTTIAWVVTHEGFEELRKDPLENSLALFDRVEGLGEKVRNGKPAHKIVGVPDLPSYLRRAWGPGWVLVGDALYHKDPTPADGIADAFRGADLLTDSLDNLLAGEPEEDTLDAYEQEFSRNALPLLEKTLLMSSYEQDAMTRATAFLEIQQLHANEIQDLGYQMPAELGA